jgi:HPt (histidine-containing phosphotransfer) domain-containing protein
VTEVIDVFLADTPAMIARLRRAASESDAAEIAAAAHAIKGSAGLSRRRGVRNTHARSKLRARSGDATNALAACDEIDASLSRLTSELRGLRERFQKS